MLKELIQKKSKEVFTKAYTAYKVRQRGYEKGFVDADAVGFADWLYSHSTQELRTMFYSETGSKNPTTEELYLMFLKEPSTKTEKQ